VVFEAELESHDLHMILFTQFNAVRVSCGWGLALPWMLEPAQWSLVGLSYCVADCRAADHFMGYY
jgi:hypothetical protein